jgi:glycosyltransferase involved in cell wall biosynthesis
MSATTIAEAASPLAPTSQPVLDVVVPVYNEQTDLEPCVRRVHAYLRTAFPYPFRVTIADNVSTDATPAIAARLADELPGVAAVRLAEKGRGRALRAVWAGSDAAVLVYLDVDLSTDLNALLRLVAPLISGHSDLAVGSRLAQLPPSGTAVISIGGFNGGDPVPTLATLQVYVLQGRVLCFVADGAGCGRGPGGGGGAGGGSQIAGRVAAHYPSTMVGGQTGYDLATPTA